MYFCVILKIHLLAHKDIKQFQCSECNYTAYTKQHLAVHLLRYSGAKPYQCDVCDYSTTINDNITAVAFGQHFAEMLPTCNIFLRQS